MINGVPSSSAADKDFARLDNQVKDRRSRKIEEVKASPFDLSKELTGHEGVRTARAGDWRMLFLADPVFFIVRIQHRREVYRRAIR